MITSYECEFCGSVYQSHEGCMSHERECIDNPDNINFDYIIDHYERMLDSCDNNNSYDQGVKAILVDIIPELKNLKAKYEKG